MKNASVKNMKKLELENGARSLLMGCLFLLAIFFFFRMLQKAPTLISRSEVWETSARAAHIGKSFNQSS